MRDFFGNAVNFIFVLIGILIFVGIFVRIFGNLYSKTKTLSAVVVGKDAYDRTLYSKSRAPEIKREYTVAFKIKNQKRYLSFRKFHMIRTLLIKREF